MKRKTLLGLLTLFLCISNGHAQGTPTFYSRVLISGDGARIVFEPSPLERTIAPIEIYDAKTHRKTGQISAARRLTSTPRLFEYEELSVESVSTDGRHLLIRRLPLAKPFQTEFSRSLENDDSDAFLEAWDIVKIPRLKWRKRGIRFSDIKWVKEQIVVLLPKEVQRWNERGEVVGRLPIPIGSAHVPSANTLSSDATRAVISTAPPSVIETRTGHVLQKLAHVWPQEPVKFMFGPNNRFIWEYSLTPDEGFVPWDNYYVWDATSGKVPKNSPQFPIFSPDGTAFWNGVKFRFESIATGKVVPPRAPVAFTNGKAFLQAISDNGSLWVGLTRQSKLFWVTTH